MQSMQTDRPAPSPAGLANALFNRGPVHKQVLASGQLPSILSHCQSDHDAPMAREWALLAIRNICEGDAEAQVGQVDGGPSSAGMATGPLCKRNRFDLNPSMQEEINSLRRMSEPMTTSGLQTK